MFLDIKMISEGSCDTEDWSNDVKNSDTNKQDFTIQIENRYFNFL